MSIIGNPILIIPRNINRIPTFTYSGNYKFGYDDDNWELALLTGNVTNLKFLTGADKIDIFLCGSGLNGETGINSSTPTPYVQAGKGGDGGKIKCYYNVSISNNVNYPITIGNINSSSGEDSIIRIGNTTYSSSNGVRRTGGVGAIARSNDGNNAVSGYDGYIAFYDALNSNNRDVKLLGSTYLGYKYGASGAGGAARYNGVTRSNGLGGINNGGNGGMWNNNNEAGDGESTSKINSGAGAGGGAYVWDNYPSYSAFVDFPGGTGDFGIIIIRNHRS